jgi:hypothetical protein
LLPLIIGVSLTTFVLIATLALSPTADELSAEAELMRRIDSVRAQPPVPADPVIVSDASRTPPAKPRFLRELTA